MAEAQAQPRELPYVAAITDAVRTVLTEQPDAFVAGEDVELPGGLAFVRKGSVVPSAWMVLTPEHHGVVGCASFAAATHVDGDDAVVPVR